MDAVPIADWGNLSATGCLVALVLWFAAKGLPTIMAKWAEEAAVARADFKEVCNGAFAESAAQRQDFKAESESLRVECRSESAAQRLDARAESALQRTAFHQSLTEQREQSARLIESLRSDQRQPPG
jgi:hypothetical protein